MTSEHTDIVIWLEFDCGTVSVRSSSSTPHNTQGMYLFYLFFVSRPFGTGVTHNWHQNPARNSSTRPGLPKFAGTSLLMLHTVASPPWFFQQKKFGAAALGDFTFTYWCLSFQWSILFTLFDISDFRYSRISGTNFAL